MSGFAEQDIAERLRGLQRLRFLMKPYRGADLVAALNATIASPTSL